MSIETDVVALLRTAGLQVSLKSVPNDWTPPFTVVRTGDSEPLNTLEGYGGFTRTDFVFDSWAGTPEDAIEQRESVVSTIRASNLNYYQLPSGEDAFEDRVAEYLESCAFSVWHA